MMVKIFLGLGSDSGDRMKYMSDAESAIERSVGKIIRRSSLYETEPWGFESESRFLNRVVEVQSLLDPPDLMREILKIESALGRIRSGKGYSSRTIDIDILFYGDEIINDGSLIVPHPHLHERKFVLVPLNEIASELFHPVLEKNVKDILMSCSDRGKVNLYKQNI